jgi:hypothetical protein
MSPTVARARATLALGFAMAAAALSLIVAVTVWQQSTRRVNDKLCNVLYSLVARSGASVGQPGSPGYAYYHSHPTELKAARAQNQRFLDDLPCHPKETP